MSTWYCFFRGYRGGVGVIPKNVPNAIKQCGRTFRAALGDINRNICRFLSQ